MTETTASLRTQLDALLRAYRAGVRRASYDGKSVEYGSAEEMRAAIASLQAALGQRGGVVVIRGNKNW